MAKIIGQVWTTCSVRSKLLNTSKKFAKYGESVNCFISRLVKGCRDFGLLRKNEDLSSPWIRNGHGWKRKCFEEVRFGVPFVKQ